MIPTNQLTAVRVPLLKTLAAFALVLAAFTTAGQNPACDSSIQTSSGRVSDEDMQRLGFGSREEARRRNADQMAQAVSPSLRDANVQPVPFETMATILLDFESIKPGETTRAEVDAKLRSDGGLASPSAVTMVHPLCRLCKMDIDYGYRRNPADQCRAIAAADDVVIRTSVPYLEWPVMG